VSSEERVLPEVSRRRQVLADAALVVVTFIWGSTFVMVKDIVEQVPPMLFLAARFALGAGAMAVLVTALGRWRGMSMRELGWGVLTGLALGLGYVLQTVGLQYTTASRAGFITGLLVVLAPIMGVFVLRQMPDRWAFMGVLLATAGLLMLAVVDTGGPGGGLNVGDRSCWGALSPSRCRSCWCRSWLGCTTRCDLRWCRCSSRA
jgi:drug/metabolite transporter (DMT)-like permease